MENQKLLQSMIFLEESLNNKSRAVATEDFKVFLKSFSLLLDKDNQKIEIKVKHFGEKCLHCQRYIQGINLQKSIRLDNMKYLCSINCFRNLKESQQKPARRKCTDESTSADSENEEMPCGSKRCEMF